MSTIMSYGVETQPQPLQVSPASGNLATASLTIVVSNPTSSPVKLEGLIFVVPVGEGGKDLTSDPQSTRAVPATNWKLATTKVDQDNASGDTKVQYVFTAEPGHGDVGSEGLTFALQNIEVNRQTGTCQFEIVEGSQGCKAGSNCPVFVRDISKFPGGWGRVSFSVNLPDVPSDKPVLYLQWDGPEGPNYEIEYFDHWNQQIIKLPAAGDPPLPHQGQWPMAKNPGLSLQQTTEFTLTVSDKKLGLPYQFQAQKTVTVAPPKPVIKDFAAEWSDAKLKLSWVTEQTQPVFNGRVEISGIPNELKPNAFFFFEPTIEQPLPREFTLTASNDSGSVTSTIAQTGHLQLNASAPIPEDACSSIAVAPDGTRVYVTSYSVTSVTVLDSSTLKQVEGSPVAIPNLAPEKMLVETSQNVIAISPKGTRVYVASYWGNLCEVFDSLTFKSLPSLPASVSNSPTSVVASNDGQSVYVAHGGTGEPISVIDAKTLETTRPESTKGAGAVQLSPNGKRIYLVSGQSGFWAVDAITFKKLTDEPVKGFTDPNSIIASPDGRLVVVSDVRNNSITVLDAHTFKAMPGSPIELEPRSKGVLNTTPMKFSPDGNLLYVASVWGQILRTLDAKTFQQIPGSPMALDNAPFAMAVHPNGAKIYVAWYSGICILIPHFAPIT